MCVLKGGDYQEREDKQVITNLADVLFYMDFQGVFERSDLLRQKMLKPCSAQSRAPAVCGL